MSGGVGLQESAKEGLSDITALRKSTPICFTSGLVKMIFKLKKNQESWKSRNYMLATEL